MTTVYAVVNDDPLIRNIRQVLESRYTLTFFSSCQSLMDALHHTFPQPNLIIIHQQLLGHQQTEVLSTLTKVAPNSRKLVYGKKQPIEIQIQALKYGARGYFCDTVPLVKLVDAIQMILEGEVWVERKVIPGLVDELYVPQISSMGMKVYGCLSPKELKVAKLVSHGASNKRIAKELNISERTVKAHLTAIFHKLDISDRLSLALLFRDIEKIRA